MDILKPVASVYTSLTHKLKKLFCNPIQAIKLTYDTDLFTQRTWGSGHLDTTISVRVSRTYYNSALHITYSQTINKMSLIICDCMTSDFHMIPEDTPWADRGGRGSAPPFLAHVVGFLTLGLKLDPLLDPPPFLLVDRRCPPPFQKSWTRPCTPIRTHRHTHTHAHTRTQPLFDT